MRQSRQWWLLAAVTALLVPLCARAQPQIIRQVVGSGAVAAASPTHAIAGTIGQTIIDRSTSSTHSALLGFWYTYPFGSTTSVRDEYVSTGTSASLRVAPNPVVANAIISLTLPNAGDVELALFDTRGSERLRLIDGWRESGTSNIELAARDLESGDYVLVLVAGGRRSATTIRVIK